MPLSTEDIITLLRTEDLYNQKQKQFLEVAALDPTYAITCLGEELTTHQYIHNTLEQLITTIRTLDDSALIREELRQERERRLRKLVAEHPWAVRGSTLLEDARALAQANAEAVLIHILGDLLFKLTGAPEYRP